MAKLPVLSAREVIKTLTKLGFVAVRQSESHIHLWHERKRVLVTVPNHPDLAKGTLLSILRQAKVSRDEFLEGV